MAYKFQEGDAILSGALSPAADNDSSMTLGAAAAEWASANVTTYSGSGNLTMGGNLSTGIYGLTSAGAATIASMAANWTNAGRTVADAGILSTVDIDGGSVDGATIGTAVQSSGKFTTLSASSTLQCAGNLSVGEYGLTSAGVATIDSFGANWTNASRTVANLGTVTDATSITTAALVASTTFNSNGNTVLGNATSDTIVTTALVSSSFSPHTDSAFDLGTSAKRWSTIYVDSIVGASTALDVALVAGGATIASSTDFALVTSAGTVTMPAASAGKYLYIKSGITGSVVLAAAGGDAFPEGAPTLAASGSAIVAIAYDADSWFIL